LDFTFYYCFLIRAVYEKVPQNDEFVKKLKTGEVLAAKYVESDGWHRAVFLKFMDPCLEDGETRCQVWKLV
jgi:hypothetical protein